jgi:preprotein translocase subunit SecA
MASSKGRRQVVRTQAFFKTIFKQDPAENTRKKYQALVDRINALEPEVQRMTDDQLRAQTMKFKQRVSNGESLESLLPEAFAVSACACMDAVGSMATFRHGL